LPLTWSKLFAWGEVHQIQCVLVVEDEPIVRFSIADQLRDQGYAVVEAETGEKAIALSSKKDHRPIVAVFTDIELSGRLSGWDVLFDKPIPKYGLSTPPGILKILEDEFHAVPFSPNRMCLLTSLAPSAL
jgi:Response regulator receiver domain